MFLDEEDIDDQLSIDGHTVTVGATTVNCLVDAPDEQLFEPEFATFIGRSIVATIKTGSIPGIAIGSAITLHPEEELYEVVKFLQYGDGALTRVLVAKAA